MKPLPKHPKQQRMEDMTFPLLKPSKKIQREYKQYQKYIDVCVGDLKKDEEYEAYWDGNNWILKDKVIWEGREWLRSINDDRHGWHVLGWVILGVAVIISLRIVL